MITEALLLNPPIVDGQIVCPFNPYHRIKAKSGNLRWVNHVKKCAHEHDPPNMVRCRWDIGHLVKVSEQKEHEERCVSNRNKPRALPPEWTAPL